MQAATGQLTVEAGLSDGEAARWPGDASIAIDTELPVPEARYVGHGGWAGTMRISKDFLSYPS